MKLKLLSLIVVITISFGAKAQMPGWAYFIWALDSNYNVYNNTTMTPKGNGLPEEIGKGIFSSSFNNGYQTITTNTSWPSSVDTNSNNSYLEFSFSGAPDVLINGNEPSGCDYSPIALQFNGYVNSIADSATFSVYIVDTSSVIFNSNVKSYKQFYYCGDITIHSTDSFLPTKALAMFPYDTGIYVYDTIPLLHTNFARTYLLVRLYPISGNKIHINNVVVNYSGGCLLPVSLVSFTAIQRDKEIILNWQTASEINTSHFNIQRSTDAISFTKVGSVNAKGAGSYTFKAPITTDDSRLTKLYYRLQIVDKDGALSYSEIRELTMDNGRLTISPNPAKSFVTITGSNIKEISIIDLYGRTLMTKEMNTNTINLAINTLSKGIYLVKAIQTNGSIKTEKLLVE